MPAGRTASSETILRQALSDAIDFRLCARAPEQFLIFGRLGRNGSVFADDFAIAQQLLDGVPAFPAFLAQNDLRFPIETFHCDTNPMLQGSCSKKDAIKTRVKGERRLVLTKSGGARTARSRIEFCVLPRGP